jgi:hypothetical protein
VRFFSFLGKNYKDFIWCDVIPLQNILPQLKPNFLLEKPSFLSLLLFVEYWDLQKSLGTCLTFIIHRCVYVYIQHHSTTSNKPLLERFQTNLSSSPCRLVPLCLMCCIWRKQNARHFKDLETSMVELRKRVLNTLYIWIASHHSLNVFMYAEFLIFCSFLLGAMLYTSCVLGLRPSALY